MSSASRLGLLTLGLLVCPVVVCWPAPAWAIPPPLLGAGPVVLTGLLLLGLSSLLALAGLWMALKRWRPALLVVALGAAAALLWLESGTGSPVPGPRLWALQSVGNLLEGDTPRPWITAAEARRRVERGAVLVDIRDPADFYTSHFAGAINLPVGIDEIPEPGRLDTPELASFRVVADALVAAYPRMPLVIYCWEGHHGRVLVQILERRGADARAVLGGASALQAEGVPSRTRPLVALASALPAISPGAAAARIAAGAATELELTEPLHLPESISGPVFLSYRDPNLARLALFARLSLVEAGSHDVRLLTEPGAVGEPTLADAVAWRLESSAGAFWWLALPFLALGTAVFTRRRDLSRRLWQPGRADLSGSLLAWLPPTLVVLTAELLAADALVATSIPGHLVQLAAALIGGAAVVWLLISPRALVALRDASRLRLRLAPQGWIPRRPRPVATDLLTGGAAALVLASLSLPGAVTSAIVLAGAPIAGALAMEALRRRLDEKSEEEVRVALANLHPDLHGDDELRPDLREAFFLVGRPTKRPGSRPFSARRFDEVVRHPTAPTLELLRAQHARDGGIGRAARLLGRRPTFPFLFTVGGRLYEPRDTAESRRPGGFARIFARLLTPVLPWLWRSWIVPRALERLDAYEQLEPPQALDLLARRGAFWPALFALLSDPNASDGGPCPAWSTKIPTSSSHGRAPQRCRPRRRGPSQPLATQLAPSISSSPTERGACWREPERSANARRRSGSRPNQR